MASINQIIYILGSKEKPMTINEIGLVLYKDEILYNRRNRVWSFINTFRVLFSRTGKRGNYMFSLNSRGMNRYNKIKDIYDPVTDTLIEE